MADSNLDDPKWEKDVLERLVFSAYKEQKTARRWGIFFKAAFLAYLILLVVLAMPGRFEKQAEKHGDHTALIDIDGMISHDDDASADRIAKGLRRAFNAVGTKGIIMRINSPGGSAVESSYIFTEIRRLREKHKDIKIYAVITDVGASGGYYVACAADEIYANEASLVGSIGVLMDGFGFVDTMKKIGAERRLITAGVHKGFMDPFSPENKFEMKFAKDMLKDVHKVFIESVKLGRGDRLKNDPLIFSGLIWTGEQAKALGLIDGFGSTGYVAREIIGYDKIINYTPTKKFFERFADKIGATISKSLQPKTMLHAQMRVE